MSKRKVMIVGGVALLVVALVGLTLAGAGTAAVWAQTGPGPFGRMMGGWSGQGGPGGMMGGSYGPGQAMMGGGTGQNLGGEPIGLDKAVDAVKAYVARSGNQDLVVDEVMEFQYNFYAIVKEKSTGTGAFELLVDKYSGVVYPEMGPNMMWNRKYGMMGGNGQGMMGGQFGTTTQTGQPTISAEDARKTAQQWLDQYQPGSSTEKPDQFYGYYTVHTLKGDIVSGMLSVNASTGQFWYHNWHGAFVRLQEVGQ